MKKMRYTCKLFNCLLWIENAFAKCSVFGFPQAGTCIGLDAISKNVFQRLATEWIDYKFIPKEYVTDGDHVVACGTYELNNRKIF